MRRPASGGGRDRRGVIEAFGNFPEPGQSTQRGSSSSEIVEIPPDSYIQHPSSNHVGTTQIKYRTIREAIFGACPPESVGLANNL
jgi:hypothetical protein